MLVSMLVRCVSELVLVQGVEDEDEDLQLLGPWCTQITITREDKRYLFYDAQIKAF